VPIDLKPIEGDQAATADRGHPDQNAEPVQPDHHDPLPHRGASPVSLESTPSPDSWCAG
jgi:hypothetical protein